MATPPTPATPSFKAKKSPGRMRTKPQNHGNIACTECKVELRKGEAATCDSCRLAKLGWKKIDTFKVVSPTYQKSS